MERARGRAREVLSLSVSTVGSVAARRRAGVDVLALTQISRNSAGNLRARVSVSFRKFPWKFATAGGRASCTARAKNGNSQTTICLSLRERQNRGAAFGMFRNGGR